MALKIFLSKTFKIFLSDFDKTQVLASYASTGLIKVLYNFTLLFMDNNWEMDYFILKNLNWMHYLGGGGMFRLQITKMDLKEIGCEMCVWIWMTNQTLVMGWCLNDHEPSESVKSGEVFLNVFRTTRFVAQRVNLDWATLSGVSVVFAL
jgi:hypothetical protein